MSRVNFIFILLLLFSFSMGCAELKPYSSLSKTASKEEKIEHYKFYEAKARRWNDWTMLDNFRLGSKKMYTVYGTSKLEHFFDASGDTVSANFIHRFNSVEKYALPVGTVASGVALWRISFLYNRTNNFLGDPWLTSAFAISMLSSIVQLISYDHYIYPAADSFNEFMRRDLDLEKSDLHANLPYLFTWAKPF
ncbi:MAG: hypothetical protein V4498_06920 [candidate division FCPU426 bacterium]